MGERTDTERGAPVSPAFFIVEIFSPWAGTPFCLAGGGVTVKPLALLALHTVLQRGPFYCTSVAQQQARRRGPVPHRRNGRPRACDVKPVTGGLRGAGGHGADHRHGLYALRANIDPVLYPGSEILYGESARRGGTGGGRKCAIGGMVMPAASGATRTR